MYSSQPSSSSFALSELGWDDSFAALFAEYAAKLMRESEWAAARGNSRQASKRSKTKKEITRDLRATYRFRDRQR